MSTPKATKSRSLKIEREPGVSEDRAMTDLTASGVAANAGLVVRYAAHEHGELSLTDMVASLKASGDAVNGNDFSGAEQMLNAQAIALNAIFAELARRSAVNMGEYLDAADRYMRLALKAQGQCRATLETLAAIKNPPVVFARQANINNGGQQQVNNGATQPVGRASRTVETESRPNELLEDQSHGGTQLDPGAKAATGRTNPRLEPVAAVHRPEN